MKTIRTILFAASCIGIWTIFGDGWIKAIGVASVLYMAVTTICTAIDESRDEA